MKFEHVLVGLDLDFRGQELTSGTRAAVEEAMWLAQLGGVRVDFLHSVEPDRFVEVGDKGYIVHDEGVPDAGMKQMEAVVARFVDEGIPAQLLLRNEKPWMAITQEVLHHGADLVLLGKHDDAETGPRIGSVSAKVLRKCPSTVWVVRPQASFPPKVVLAATDLTAVGTRALECASMVSESCHSEAHVLHAYPIPIEGQWTQPLPVPEVAGLHDNAVAAVREHVAGTTFAASPRLHVTCATPYHSILRAVDDLDVDLLVMGSVGRGGVPGFFFGNTAEKVLPKIDASLLVVKPDDFVCPVELGPVPEAHMV